jgi:anti-anti-sigma factor
VSTLDFRVNSSRLGSDSFAVAVSGELDLYAAEQLQLRLGGHVEGGARSVLVDLLGVSFMDSAGLSVLLSAARALRSVGGQLVVVADNHGVLRMIELGDGRRFLHVERTLLEGIQYVVDQRLAQ